MDAHASIGYKYGRDLQSRVNFLGNDLNETKEWDKYLRLLAFMNIFTNCTGGALDMGTEHAQFFQDTEDYSLEQINKVFFERYSLHIWHTFE
ncbi:hypothetical protein [Vibrio hyugaensis]|uniref:hypothetical protein n=1 Tax=Vibrio hyugaensis TaxID=1534743 RepID=UPI000CE31B1A|nr:hypothetical protein [Vibrio hyugaensis]